MKKYNEKEILLEYQQAYEIFKEEGVDCNKVIKELSNFSISFPCWQGDDVKVLKI